MATKIKVVRNITYKAYAINEGTEITPNAHVGKYFTKSDCHYYCEKDCLDAIKAEPIEGTTFAIYQVSTVEDSTVEDKLIEIITYSDGVITIK